LSSQQLLGHSRRRSSHWMWRLLGRLIWRLISLIVGNARRPCVELRASRDGRGCWRHGIINNRRCSARIWQRLQIVEIDGMYRAGDLPIAGQNTSGLRKCHQYGQESNGSSVIERVTKDLRYTQLLLLQLGVADTRCKKHTSLGHDG